MKNRQEFAQQIIEHIRGLVISSIIETRVRLIRQGGYLKGLCPFHNDRHIGSFIVSDKKGIFKCFSCGIGGDAIKFIAELDGLNYVESAMKIGIEIGIVSLSEYEDFYSRKFDNLKAKRIERIYVEKDIEKNKSIIAEPEVLNKVFSLFSKGESLMDGKSKLSLEHKQYLLEERNLSEEDIEEGGYFTFPSRWVMKHFIKALNRNGMDEKILKDIPGFYKIKETGHYNFIKYNGIGIPIRNANGQIVGIQIRRDKIQENMSRYIWFSSTFLENDEEERYQDCTSSGAPIDVVYPSKIKNKTLIITEGRFKAKQIANKLGSIAFSVQGVGNWKNISEEIKIVQKRNKNIKFLNIWIAFDADMSYNIQVFNQAKKMAYNLSKELTEITISYCLWLMEDGKGIDDVLLNCKDEFRNVFEYIKANTFKEIYETFEEKIIREEVKTGRYENINKVPKELIKAYFDRDVLPKIPILYNRYKN